MTELQLSEVNPMKSVSGAEFPRGLQEFVFSIGRPSAWIPSKSYFVIDMTLTASGGVPVYNTDQIAFADSCASNLYSNVYFRCGGQDVSSIVSYVPQAAAAKNRLNKTGAWLNTIGKSAYMLDADFAERSKLVSTSITTAGSTYIEAGPAAATVAIATATGVVTGADGANFANVLVGDTLTVNGKPYTVTALTSATEVTVAPPPAANVVATTNFTFTRQGEVKTVDGKNRVQVIWQPPIGIFDHTKPMGSGDYRFSLNPNSDYQKSAVEAVADKTIGAGAGQFDLTINSVKFYAATIKMEIPSQVDNLYLMECLVQAKTAVANTNSLQFTVPSSTRALSVFFQSDQAGQNTRFPPSKFTTTGSEEQNMTSLQITYANTTKPNTRWDSALSSTTNQNRLQQRYVDTLRECNLIDNVGGAETLDDFIKRGGIYHYSFTRDASDRSTQVQLSTTFNGTGISASKVFLVAYYSRVTEVTTQDGLIVSVRSLEA